jgi:hypothetical protein
VSAIRPLQEAEITDPVLITVSQLTVELDNVLFPINRKSTEKEPQTWQRELQGQHIPRHVLDAVYRNVKDQPTATLRAKKAVSCLLWMTDKPLSEIEAAMTQFGGSTGGAAGAIRGVTSRTCDVLPVVADIAQILDTDLNLGDRIEKLLVRLEMGLPSGIAQLAKYTGSSLNRGDYQRLIRSGLFDLESIEKAGDEKLLECVDDSSVKLEEIRKASEKKKESDENDKFISPILPLYMRLDLKRFE